MSRKILLATVLVLLLSGVSAQGNIVVFQCPASFRQTEQNIIRVREFFSRIDPTDLRFAWEPRGVWSEDLVLQLCEEGS